MAFHDQLLGIHHLGLTNRILDRLIRDSEKLLDFRSATTGVSGFHWAVRWGHLNAVTVFSQKYPSIDLHAAWTPLAYAIRGRHLGIVEFLLSKRADPQAQ